MQARLLVKTFTDRYAFIGPVVWMLAVQYFIIQVIAAQAWKTPYSLTLNTISDLGNTTCGSVSGRLVCSPLHGLMNASFITLGITMALGAGLIYQEFKQNTGSFVGFSFMAAAGVGTTAVGLFPENTVSILHIIGATLPFFIGNLGMIILSFALDIPKPLRYYTFLSGAIALMALVFFGTHHYLGIGIGGMERLTAYPQTVWLIVFGVYIASNHIKRDAASAVRRHQPPLQPF
jgi:hypothetical membrane protein